MSKRKRNWLGTGKAGASSSRPATRKALRTAEFDVFTLGVDGKEGDHRPRLVRRNRSCKGDCDANPTGWSVGDCEIKWVSFADGTMEDILKWELRDA